MLGDKKGGTVAEGVQGTTVEKKINESLKIPGLHTGLDYLNKKDVVKAPRLPFRICFANGKH